MARRKAGKLGEILLATSLITAEELGKAVATQAKTGKRLGQILIEQGVATEDDVAWALSNQLMYPYVYLNRETVDHKTARLLPERFLRERNVIPIHRLGQQVTLAMADPTDQRTVDEVEMRTGLQVNRAVALESNIGAILDQLPAEKRKEAKGPPQDAEAQYLQFHLVQALQEGASEIHFDQSVSGQHRVRYRIQGVLVDRAGHPAELHTPLLNCLREFAGMGKKTPASAATTVAVGEVEAYAVVAIVPAVGGPTATVALFPYRSGVPDLVPLGVDSQTVEALLAALQKPRGGLVIGCEDPLLRSTLIRALLPGTPRGKVWALETLPVYRNPAITQTAIGSSAEAAGLLAGAARAGADLVAVDDASHPSTLLASLECARTRSVVVGHPQGDIAGLAAHVIAVAGGALAASTLTGMLAARKVRLLCPECKERLRQAGGAPGGRRTFIPRGCGSCGFTGFRGYRAITGVWLLGADDRVRVRGGAAAGTPAHLAPVVTSAMRAQGYALLDDGLTSIDELSGALKEP